MTLGELEGLVEAAREAGVPRGARLLFPLPVEDQGAVAPTPGPDGRHPVWSLVAGKWVAW